MRPDAEYRALGIPNASPFDWKVDSVQLTRDQRYAKEYYQRQLAARGKSQAAIQKAQILRENPHIDLSAYGITNSERAGR